MRNPVYNGKNGTGFGARMASIDHVLDTVTMRKVQKRLGLLIALGLAIALLLSVDPHWYWPGLIVSVAGLLMQLWELGSIRSRKLLPVNGPYMFVRNPKYIARFVLILGLVLMTGEPWLVLIYVPLFVLYTVYQVGKEEELLEDEFGTQYLRYCKTVPRFVPRLKPYENGRFWFFSMKHFQRQYGEILLLLSTVLYASCYLVAVHLK